MDCEYDLFERMPDGSLLWRDFERGREQARRKLAFLILRQITNVSACTF